MFKIVHIFEIMMKVRTIFLVSFYILAGIIYCNAQNTTTSTKPDLLDERYLLSKGSYLHKGDSTLRLNQSKSIMIYKVAGDTIYIGLIEKPSAQITNSLFSLVPQQEKMYMLTSEGMDKVRFTDWDVSPLVIPIKIRPKTADNPLQFISDVSIGPYFGYQRGSQRYSSNNEVTEHSTTFALFATPSLVRLDPSTVPSSSSNTGSVLGFSVGGGILFNIDQYQLGLVAGLDWISGTASTSWIYQGKPWYSFSFAFNLSNQ